MVFITHIILTVHKRDSETRTVVNLSKANLKPMSGKMVKFGKKIGKWSIKDNGFTGLKWYNKNNENEHQNKPYSYKYQSPYIRDYNRSGYISDEIIIYAKPNKITSYIFYEKNLQKLYFGVTDSSFTFHPNRVVHIYSEEHDSLEQVPLFIDLCYVNGSKNVNKCRKDMNLSPIPNIMLSFRPRIFSSSFDLTELENPVFGEPNIINNIQLPYTGIKKKELLKRWMEFKNGIPRQIPQREVRPNHQIVHRVMEDGTNSDEEPLDVRRDRLRRNRAIEAAIEASNYEEDIVTLERLPEPDENGYINFVGLDTDNYNINDPTALFHGFRVDDNGYTDYFAINGRFVKFNPANEVKLEQGQYGFYWCPTDKSFGIRYKKITQPYSSSNNNEDNENNDTGTSNEEREPAHMVNKYIYLEVLNPGLLGDMQPTTIDFYTRSYYHLGRLEYNQVDIASKNQIIKPWSEIETAWENRFNNN